VQLAGAVMGGRRGFQYEHLTAKIQGDGFESHGVPPPSSTGRSHPNSLTGAPLRPSGASPNAGEFTLDGMKPGPLALMPLADSWADGAGIELDVAPVVVMDGVVLTLRVGGRIEGFAFDEAGNPLVGRRVTWSATAMGMGSTKGVTPTMETGATLIITVEDPEGRLQRASLEVRDSDGRDVGGMRTVSARTVMFNEGFSTIEQRLGPPPPTTAQSAPPWMTAGSSKEDPHPRPRPRTNHQTPHQ
jgi:hypothetical protein